MSTFSGLEVAKRALFTQQSALHTTGHNIANANTPGYSRQRVNFVQETPYPTPGRNRPEIPGQIGQGVQAGSVQRVRDQFVDMQFRAENNKSGYWESRAGALSQMEQILNEPSDTGLSSTINQFWQSLNDLSVNPEDSGARSVVQQRGIAVADTFNYVSDSLKAIQSDLKDEIDVTTKDINSLVSQISKINDQVKAIEPHGYLPNDLYDKRDQLIDELSEMVNIKVTFNESSKSSKDIAQGIASIELVDREGQALSADKLIDGNNKVNQVSVGYEEVNGQRVVNGITVGGSTITPEEFTANGKLKGLMESHGYSGNGKVKGIYTSMLKDIDQMAFAFAQAFNNQHEQGITLKNEQGQAFFKIDESFSADNYIGYASEIDLTDTIKNDEDNIAAALVLDENGDPMGPQQGQSYLGNGENAQALADIKDKVLGNLLGENTTVDSFYEGIIGDLGVQAQEANRMSQNADTLKGAVESRRQSISGVSLDEEMTNMIKFQHAYNAAARNMTVVDEMLDRIINQMGLVGR
ncbi:flagellar hook-associated protein FlgK [Salinibacillus xinjiangensis]|uniref:Flagellar hook-associated protein 1 n=1 Tax=Salinibacillus xinjiangensis TaxID=1229268 RepID=A0A6G1X1M1_9BACI|nr:flagellar hook-associated protein FlgK [Salinibacillus xinjiangensis]MRG84786.1 flagellar hook-associated protein FlgK [Salinibacillus xinjiangensis]